MKSVFNCYLQSSFIQGNHLIIPHLQHVSQCLISRFCPSVCHRTLTSIPKSFPKLFHAYKQISLMHFTPHLNLHILIYFGFILLFGFPLSYKLVKRRKLVLLTGSKIIPIQKFGLHRVFSLLCECYETHEFRVQAFSFGLAVSCNCEEVWLPLSQ